MATCTDCAREMTKRVSCTLRTIVLNSRSYARIPYGKGTWGRIAPLNRNAACHDCGCPPGAIHHGGCSMEECPSCHSQLLSCACELSAAPAESAPATLELPALQQQEVLFL